MKALQDTNLRFHFSKDNENLLEDFKTKMIHSAFSEAILAIFRVKTGSLGSEAEGRESTEESLRAAWQEVRIPWSRVGEEEMKRDR